MNWFRKNEDEEHNFFQNYTDLLSGFLIVFIIASLIFYRDYITLDGWIKQNGGDVKGVTRDLELARKLKSFARAQMELTKDNKYIYYNAKADRFECDVNSIFEPNQASLISGAEVNVLEAGEELNTILEACKSDNIEFKLIIEGRASRYRCEIPDVREQQRLERVSLERAKYLYNVWKTNHTLTQVSDMEKDIVVTGSGVFGYHRYSGVEKEDLNRRVVIQIIPFIKYREKK